MTLDHRILLLDKPAGLTSFAAVHRLRRLGGVEKAGHCGSLDPRATGLLVVCTGVGTRLASLFVDQPKEYEGRVRFGRATDSYDADGRTTREAPVPPLAETVLRAALRQFEGEIDQIPPMVSALKVDGRRLYQLARQGTEIERAPRKVQVYGIDLVELGPDYADLRVRCGRGCYVRSIAHDLGAALGLPAHLESLRRLAIGALRVEDALTLEDLAAVREGGVPAWGPRAVRTVPQAIEFLPAVRVRRAFEDRVRNGGQPAPHFLVQGPAGPGPCRIMTDDGRWLLALARSETVQAPLRLELVFPQPLAVEPEAAPA